MMSGIKDVSPEELAGLGQDALSDLEAKIVRARQLLGATALDTAVTAEQAAPVDPSKIASPAELTIAALGDLREFVNSAVSDAIAEGKLPEDYALPSLGELEDQAAKLAPIYDTFMRNLWSPTLVFVPRGLRPEDMAGLTEGFSLDSDGMRVTGDTRIKEGIDDPSKVKLISIDSREDRRPLRDGEPKWELAVTTDSDAVLFPRVSPKGEGQKAENLLEQLVELNLPADADPEALIAAASPTAPMYLAIQWQRLIRDKKPTGFGDPVAAVLLKEKIEDTRRVTADGAYDMTLTGEWNNSEAAVIVSTAPSGYSDHILWGVSPAIRARDLEPVSN